MAWCCQASSHYLSQFWPKSLSPYVVTMSQPLSCWIFVWSWFGVMHYQPWLSWLFTGTGALGYCPKASDETLKNGWSIGDPGFYTLNSTANLSISPPVTWSWACGSYRRLCNTPPYLLSNQWLQAYLASAVLEPRASADVWGHPSGYGTHRRSVSSCPPHGVVGLEADSISWSRSSGTGIPSVLADPVWDNVNSVIHYDQWGYILMA